MGDKGGSEEEEGWCGVAVPLHGVTADVEASAVTRTRTRISVRIVLYVESICIHSMELIEREGTGRSKLGSRKIDGGPSDCDLRG